MKTQLSLQNMEVENWCSEYIYFTSKSGCKNEY